jgi:hypothetical protein
MNFISRILPHVFFPPPPFPPCPPQIAFRSIHPEHKKAAPKEGAAAKPKSWKLNLEASR